MVKNKKHSPLKNRPLRSSGQSLDEKISYIFIIFVFFIVALIEWTDKIFNKPPSPIIWTVIAVVASVYFMTKIIKLWTRFKNIKLGREGEKIVGQSLEKLREMGYEVFHDTVVGEIFNIDHVIIGPAGVFTIETKTRSKLDGVQKIKRNGNYMIIDGLGIDRKTIFQSKLQAHWLEDFISSSIGLKIAVKPVVIFPDWFVEPQPRGADVWILNQKALPSFLKNEGVVIDEDKINLISAQIEKYNRDAK
ncbi:MAG: NERD domain protein [Candidatus Moranbacteria bacterium GW2011_GWF2_35_54]|nr:MAG: NERD domain protein [Candidatus Moranbacteria bacterium GW2011_GWF2_35_54]